jgi:hypothetical protein
MGQYFRAVNLDKREVICPFCIGDSCSLWGWAAQPKGAVFSFLLQTGSPEGGSIAGHWAGDRLALVGDYDSPDIYKESHTYRNISKDLVEPWNNFIGVDELKLKLNPCPCQQRS